MLISKKTWCFEKECDGNFVRRPLEDGDIFFHDKCDKCGARKSTWIYGGDIAYYDKNGTFIPLNIPRS